ncbi:MAG: hypothetical protein WCP08_03340 [Prolixibacteraceae bacterium]
MEFNTIRKIGCHRCSIRIFNPMPIWMTPPIFTNFDLNLPPSSIPNQMSSIVKKMVTASMTTSLLKIFSVSPCA